MNTELKKRVQERYSVLLTERDEFVSKANQKLGEYAGRLAELEEMFKQLIQAEAEDLDQLTKAKPAIKAASSEAMQ